MALALATCRGRRRGRRAVDGAEAAVSSGGGEVDGEVRLVEGVVEVVARGVGDVHRGGGRVVIRA